jgi:benzoyl-CoA reductase subunit B
MIQLCAGGTCFSGFCGMSTTVHKRFKQDRDALCLGVQALQENESPDKQLTVRLAKAIVENYDRVIDCAENGKPFVASSYGNAPEIFVAMDLPWYTLSVLPFLPISEPSLLEDIDEAERLGLGTDMCTLIRLGIQYAYAGYVPPPTAFVGLLCPCDGASVLHQALARNRGWQNVPMFCTDPPYAKSERGIDFFAEELRRMIAFLEKHTGAVLDAARLRETVRESNKQYGLWSEYNQLRRAVPSPRGVARGARAWNVAQNFMVGDPKGTDWFEQLVRLTEQDVREGRCDTNDEKIRLFWFDVHPVWFRQLIQWLREEWRACIVMDMLTYAPYTPIDTSSEESILRGLAKRYSCDVPMVRQVHGPADNYIYDITRVVKDYKIDCVIWPGHMGHKDGAAGIGIMRQVCSDLGVPFMDLGLDLLDRRYTPIDDVKAKISHFFSAIGFG